MIAYDMIIAYEVTKQKMREDKRQEKTTFHKYEC